MANILAHLLLLNVPNGFLKFRVLLLVSLLPFYLFSNHFSEVQPIEFFLLQNQIEVFTTDRIQLKLHSIFQLTVHVCLPHQKLVLLSVVIAHPFDAILHDITELVERHSSLPSHLQLCQHVLEFVNFLHILIQLHLQFNVLPRYSLYLLHFIPESEEVLNVGLIAKQQLHDHRSTFLSSTTFLFYRRSFYNRWM